MPSSYVRYSKFAGWQVSPDNPGDTWAAFKDSRALGVVARLEMPKGFGSVQNYDGAGASAGVLHHVAVYPKTMTQGTLPTLIGRCLEAASTVPAGIAKDFLTELGKRGLCVAEGDKGWYFSRMIHGKPSLTPASGRLVRESLSGRLGIAEKATLPLMKAMCEFFAHEGTWGAQIAYAMDWLKDRNAWGDNAPTELLGALDASLTVNAPAYALRARSAARNGKPEQALQNYRTVFATYRKTRLDRTEHWCKRLNLL